MSRIVDTLLTKNAIVIGFLSVMLCVSGCISHEQAKRLFVRERDYDIGRHITEVPLPPPSRIEAIDDNTSAYVYEAKNTGCRFSYLVDNKTKRVRSWQFLSNPDSCYLEFRGGG